MQNKQQYSTVEIDAESGKMIFRCATKPNHNRRKKNHDYCAPAIYLITISKNPAVSSFSLISHDSSPEAYYNSSFQSPTLMKYALLPGKAIVPVMKISSIGECITEALAIMQEKFPKVRFRRYAIMPDHFHVVIEVKERLEGSGLPEVIRKFKGVATGIFNSKEEGKDLIAKVDAQGIKGDARSKAISLWDAGFNDRIAKGEGCVARFVRYVTDNPLRYLLKRMHPEFFRKVMNFSIDDDDYTLYGNLLLLREPEKVQVRFSSKFSADEWKRRQHEIRGVINRGGVVVSPFIHEKEKVLKDEAISQGASVIYIFADGLSERFQPKGEIADLCAAGRLLIVAPRQYHSRRYDLRRSRCLDMNTLAEKIATLDDERIQLRCISAEGWT